MSDWRADGWLPISAAGAAGVTIVDAALIERRFGLFRGGFLAPDHLETAGQRVTFLLLSGLADLVVVGLLAGITLWLANRWGLSAVPRRVLALAMGVAPLALADLFSYELLSYVGDAFDLSLMWDLVGRQPREFLAVGAAHLAEPLWLIAIASALLAAVVWLLQRRFPGGPAALTRRGPTVTTLVLLVLVGTVGVTAGSTLSEPVEAGLRRKPSARAMAIVVNRVSDVDRDGYGVGARPADANPFDASIHPYAADLPGNGIDEDGVGGDLPVAASVYSEGPATAPAWAWKPDVVLVLLESVRADVLDAVIDGHPATPTLRGMAQAGGSAPLAFSHNGFTYQSRFHLFSGSLVGVRGGRTLIDDFKGNGYRVGYFSGQDDSFGGPELAVGFDRADAFFDARSAPDRRYTQFSTPGSLAVPASVVVEKATAFVAGVERAVPMFLYVNFHDTHYPYHYRAIEPLISRTVLEPGADWSGARRRTPRHVHEHCRQRGPGDRQVNHRGDPRARPCALRDRDQRSRRELVRRRVPRSRLRAERRADPRAIRGAGSSPGAGRSRSGRWKSGRRSGTRSRRRRASSPVLTSAGMRPARCSSIWARSTGRARLAGWNRTGGERCTTSATIASSPRASTSGSGPIA